MRQKPRCGLAVESVLICLIMNPYRHLIRRWNWKSACLSAFSRGTAILLANLSAGAAGAIGAMSAEICYRALTSGFYSSATQAFRYARPLWGASVVSIALLPVIGETLEFTMHRMRGTHKLGATIAVSVVLTAISTLLELFAMRRGVLIMGQTGGSLIQDLKKVRELICALAEEALHRLMFIPAMMRQCLTISSQWMENIVSLILRSKHRIYLKYFL
jgi:hypothetical protein